MSAPEPADSAELRRRLRRILAVFRAIAAHTDASGGDARDSARHLAGRIGAIGRAGLAATSGGMDLQSLVLDELLALGAQRAAIVNGPEVRLNAKSAELMSLAIHELATNAVKFGALSQSQTELRVVWWFTDSGGSRLHFEWAENGVRVPHERRHTPGFGSQVIKRMIAAELHGDGEMLLLKEGMLCTIELPAREALLEND
jgi:two-component sensor histidine kinase